MAVLNKAQILAMKHYWENLIETEFVQKNTGGTEWWKVRHKESGRVVNCSSKLASYKIALLAFEMLDGCSSDELSVQHRILQEKARFLSNVKAEDISWKYKRKATSDDYKFELSMEDTDECETVMPDQNIYKIVMFCDKNIERKYLVRADCRQNALDKAKSNLTSTGNLYVATSSISMICECDETTMII